MIVRRSYRNYSTEAEEHTEDQITDEQGRAYFPAQWMSASTARRCIFTVLAARTGFHASFGRHAHVFTFGNGMEGFAVTGDYVTDWTGHPASMKSRIVTFSSSTLR